ncbi:putative peptide/nitrate transporter [Golovinomyces cichoracearum]|uniref:Putative peptide/nitrate transporter n=1 Tax=Golovinomyces cichoracearum TaxID=62708 RepID=A0A420J0F3_9PEZI|nr:putative peptide/nitrate transporter [Golovinomyces cichoracearum]
MATTPLTKARNLDEFPTRQLFLLAIVRLAEPIALTSIFPYSWKLVKNFGVADENHASFYSGLLISAFSLAEAITGMFWGSVSDRVGRKPILLCGCAGTVLSMITIGLAQNFWIALAGRVIGGMLNGNIAVIQTMVGELVTKPEYEPRAYSVMPFVWSMGTIIGPAIGGTFVEPAQSFPAIFSSDGVFAKFPYLLPNLICASILVVGIIIGYLFIEETHPRIRLSLEFSTPTYISEEAPLTGYDSSKFPIIQTRVKTYGTQKPSHRWLRKKSYQKDAQPRIFTNRIIGLVIAMGIFSFHSITFEQILPIFLEDKPATNFPNQTDSLNALSSGGLGMSIKQVGFIMSIDGLLALLAQALVFPFAGAYFGLHRIFLIASILHPITFIVMPQLTHLPPYLLNFGIYFCLTIRNVLSITAFSAILISLKEATPTLSVLGKVNGLASSVGSASRTIAPPIAGYIYGLGSHLNMNGLVWYLSAIVAGIGAIQAFTVRGSRSPDEENWKDEEVTTLVNPSFESWDSERDSGSSTTMGFESDLSEDSF